MKDDRSNKVAPSTISRRGYLSSISGAVGIAAGINSVSAYNGEKNVTEPNVPNTVQNTEWSDTESLGRDNKDDVIEWNGYRLQHTDIQNEVESQLGISDVPLWQVYGWRMNMLDIPSGSNNDDKSWLDIVDFNVGLGSFGSVSANLGDIAEKLFDSGEYIPKIAMNVFSEQVESDYPFIKVNACDGLYNEWNVGCRVNEIDYTDASAEILGESTITSNYEVEADGGSTYEINYRGLFVIKTYDGDKRHNLSKTFVAAGAVYPEKIDGSFLSDSFTHDYNYINRSREFLKKVR